MTTPNSIFYFEHDLIFLIVINVSNNLCYSINLNTYCVNVNIIKTYSAQSFFIKQNNAIYYNLHIINAAQHRIKIRKLTFIKYTSTCLIFMKIK